MDRASFDTEAKVPPGKTMTPFVQIPLSALLSKGRFAADVLFAKKIPAVHTTNFSGTLGVAMETIRTARSAAIAALFLPDGESTLRGEIRPRVCDFVKAILALRPDPNARPPVAGITPLVFVSARRLIQSAPASYYGFVVLTELLFEMQYSTPLETLASFVYDGKEPDEAGETDSAGKRVLMKFTSQSGVEQTLSNAKDYRIVRQCIEIIGAVAVKHGARRRDSTGDMIRLCDHLLLEDMRRMEKAVMEEESAFRALAEISQAHSMQGIEAVVHKITP